jgi:diguanylate cyclase (GGDEF)-like protein/PAS domain S-box-containing protein
VVSHGNVTAQHLYEASLRRDGDHAAALASVAVSVGASGMDLAGVVDVITGELARHVGDQATLSLVAPGDRTVIPVSVRGRDPVAARLAAGMFEGRPVPVDDPLFAGDSLRERRTTVVEIPEADRGGGHLPDPYREHFARYPVHHVLNVPLVPAGRLLGLVSVVRLHPEPFTADEVRLAEDIAARAAYAIANGQLYDALLASETLLRLTQQHAATGIALIERDGRWRQVNPALCTMMGRSEDELRAVTDEGITDPDDRGTGLGALGQLFAGAVDHVEVEKRYRRPDGSVVWVEVHVSALRDDGGAVEHLIAQYVDITDRKANEQLLAGEMAVRQEAEENARRERDFLSVLLASIGEGYLYTADDRIVDVNEQLCRLTGFSRRELIGLRPPFPFWPPDDAAQIARRWRETCVAGGGELDVEFVHLGGDPVPVSATIRSVHNADRSTLGYITTISDRTAVRDREALLREAASVDPLTGLFNRRSIDEHFARIAPGDAAVVLDLDRFKQVNDTHGHAVGDEALIALAGCVRSTLRGEDWAGRLGGEEFLIVVCDGGEAGAAAVMNRLRSTWTATRPLTTFSAGIAVHTAGAEPRQTLARADAAMYDAKRAGRDRTEIWVAGRPVTAG